MGDGWLDEREQRAWRGLMAMQADVTQYVERTLRNRSGLSRADYEVLVLLSEAPPERLRAFEIGRALRWEKSRLSQHLTRMERRGLVRREKCASDQRGHHVVLTPHGRQVIEAAAGPHVAAVRALLLDHVTPEQLDTICELARLVRARVEALDDGRSDDPSDAVPGGAGHEETAE
ncbi:MarR family transcriptional regulator [Actinomycetospora sp. TBRC 11914]|uniref:MarR family winged helix-turn-helix transcriptional regulator n=1 Tax=Actinomycetospora sp. TBRC 11914 TaxID=2729387 RepID=UPI0028A0F195|nr:MarR family transcriptional regulator [Actinomycetospora sp. TBRC 11914]